MKTLGKSAGDTGSTGIPVALVALLAIVWYLNRKERTR